MRHDAANPLALDVLVVDEASMVDLALMAKLVVALPPKARLILLGDKDQLAAVEAGAVFAELCEGRGFDARAASELERITGQPVPVEAPRSRLGDAVVLLTHSHRFAGDSGIGELARRDQRRRCERQPSRCCRKVVRISPERGARPDRLDRAAGAGLRRLPAGRAAGRSVRGVRGLQRFPGADCATRGPVRRDRYQRGAGNTLQASPRRAGPRALVSGRAVMVRQNDYALGLFNGDIGLCLKTEQACECSSRVTTVTAASRRHGCRATTAPSP